MLNVARLNYCYYICTINLKQVITIKKLEIMKYTEKQIENAKKAYNNMMVLQTIKDYDVNYLGWVVANQRLEFHNKIVNRVINGCEETIKEWKLLFRGTYC